MQASVPHSRMQSSPKMINCENLKKSYNGEEVLRKVSLEIRDGEFVSVMGKSGSGKSTLISIMGAHLAPDSGRVLHDGVDIFSLGEREIAKMRCTFLGFVFQNFRLIPTLNVKDNLLLPSVLAKSADKAREEYIEMLAERLEISAMLGKFPTELSGGQCQRAAIVRALSIKPKTLILDEPTGALDTAMERRVMELLTEINRECGATVIQVTHSEAVAAYGSRIIRIRDGEIVE